MSRPFATPRRVGAQTLSSISFGDGTTPGEALSMLARRGTYLIVGYGGTLQIPTADLVIGELSIGGSLIGTHNELAELIALAERGMVTVTTRTYPLDAINDAIEDLREGRIQGPRGHHSVGIAAADLPHRSSSTLSAARSRMPALEPPAR